MQGDEVEFTMPITVDTAAMFRLSPQEHTRTRFEQRRLNRLPHHEHYGTQLQQCNSRYISNVSIGFTLRPLVPHVRFRPYTKDGLRLRERQRTRSENNDGDKDLGLVKAVVEDVIKSADELSQLKKAKSLESIVAESNSGLDLQSITIASSPPPPSDVEVVSKSIQNLRVGE